MAKLINYDRPKLTTINDTAMQFFLKAAEKPGTLGRVNEFDIEAVNTTNETFSIPGDYTALFTSAVVFVVSGSTGNDGTWTVASSTFTGGATVITVNENVTDATVDGIISTGNTGILDLVIEVDADESGGTDLQSCMKVTLTPSIDIISGVISLAVVFTGVTGVGADETTQTKTFNHGETMDAWQTGAGRARQS